MEARKERKPWSEEARKRHLEKCHEYQRYLKHFKMICEIDRKCEAMGIDTEQFLIALKKICQNRDKLRSMNVEVEKIADYLQAGMTGEAAYSKLLTA